MYSLTLIFFFTRTNISDFFFLYRVKLDLKESNSNSKPTEHSKSETIKINLNQTRSSTKQLASIASKISGKMALPDPKLDSNSK